MVLENKNSNPNHKRIIISVSSLLVAFMIASSIFMYLIFTKQTAEYNELNNKLADLEADTQQKFSELSEGLLDTKSDLKDLGLQLGSIDTEIAQIKATTSADFSGIIEGAIKSVVTVRTDISQGSGFIIADGGYIVTNAHVMTGAAAAGVITYDEKLHAVTKIGEDTAMDITLLRIIDESYSPLQLGDSNDVQVGEKVIAIGNPLGLQFSVSEGIVSAIHRQGENGLEAYIQTDAALNPGNSGGPLIDSSGKVIGINNFKVGGGESLGFALESNYIKQTVNSIYQQSHTGTLI
ncbi:MAG: trypsin-like peptidase domain-containing protein [Candidatus Nanoarchaeia archaeon]|nr:trypsin-like peptidase domain-containing protein [Candidatus Nanoarchaeia archaeon]MDD5358016.1 trypsin-like peptidase domain-containing protein [Candidatus Nanoarchaeia archaeon]MDD5588935.1 trypsin-like peptidase domain-containing protein [Candidatus Nanoarchaeia archaeon]